MTLKADFRSITTTAIKTTALTITLLTGALLTATQAQAGADCPEAPRSSWLSALAMQQKIVNEYGFSIRKFKIDDNCYEIYGYAPAKADPSRQEKVEVYFNPVDGSIVKLERED